jgi:hypothetical protein
MASPDKLVLVIEGNGASETVSEKPSGSFGSDPRRAILAPVPELAQVQRLYSIRVGRVEIDKPFGGGFSFLHGSWLDPSAAAG